MTITLDRLREMGVLRHCTDQHFDTLSGRVTHCPGPGGCIRSALATIEAAVRDALEAALSARKEDGWSAEGWEAKKIAYHAGLERYGLEGDADGR